MRKHMFKYYVEQHHLDWQCSFCSLPKLSDSFFNDDLQGVGNDRSVFMKKSVGMSKSTMATALVSLRKSLKSS